MLSESLWLSGGAEVERHHSHTGEGVQNALCQSCPRTRPLAVSRTGFGMRRGWTPSWYGRDGGWHGSGRVRKRSPERYREWSKEAAEDPKKVSRDEETVTKTVDDPVQRSLTKQRDQVNELHRILDGKRWTGASSHGRQIGFSIVNRSHGKEASLKDTVVCAQHRTSLSSAIGTLTKAQPTTRKASGHFLV